ncbi:MAG: hypothetical protein KBB88_00135 [Candidatus Pacebacteria bacterium]|nr:hypothetical protein [Candidatus Paceibacterota bacterium]
MNWKILIVFLLLISVISVLFITYEKNKIPVVEDSPVVSVNELASQDGLPDAVENKRQAIYKAALERNYERLAKETGSNFHYSFGGDYESGFAEYLKLSEKDEKNSSFDTIITLLNLPYAVNGNIYSWPSFFTVEPSMWTEKDISLMKTFLTNEEIESYREFGGYIYYRIGITSDGEWIYYLAGD